MMSLEGNWRLFASSYFDIKALLGTLQLGQMSPNRDFFKIIKEHKAVCNNDIGQQ